jgi:glyoxylase-like metal-dependent hydrolase (beta-lactamase superfamily II)
LIFNNTGYVGEGLYVVGNNRMPSYLIKGSRSVSFDAGLSCLGPAYRNDILKILDGAHPEMLFLTHMHFDHCGSAAYLKKGFPEMVIAGSLQASEIIVRPNALDFIAKLNRSATENLRKLAPDLVSQEEFKPFSIDRILSDGERIELGEDLQVQVLATPGHTRDMLSYYLPKQKILIAVEAGGAADGTGYLITEFLSDYEDYIRTIKRLDELEVDIFCQGHNQVFTGKDAQGFFNRSLKAAQDFRAMVEGFLREEGGDVQKTILRVKAVEYDPKPQPKQPEPAYLINIQARVKHLAQLLEKEK